MGDTPCSSPPRSRHRLPYGIGLLAASAWVFWWTAADLVIALFTGNVAEILVGVLLVAPLVASIAFSTLGLLLEVVLSQRALDTDTRHREEVNRDDPFVPPPLARRSR